MAYAILLKPNGEPIGGRKIVYKDDPITGLMHQSEGKTVCSGLKSGIYRLLAEEYADFTVEIPKDAKVPFDLGSIVLKMQKND